MMRKGETNNLFQSVGQHGYYLWVSSAEAGHKTITKSNSLAGNISYPLG